MATSTGPGGRRGKRGKRTTTRRGGVRVTSGGRCAAGRLNKGGANVKIKKSPLGKSSRKRKY